MTGVRFEAGWSYQGCRVLRIENDRLQVDVLPELGGKIFRILDKTDDRQWMWHHPRLTIRPLPLGLSYDDHFFGGWDEVFPNAGAGEHQGESFPDHGEYWATPFAHEVLAETERVTLHLWADGPITATRMDRWLTLRAGSSALECKYRISHHGEHPLTFLWSSHPAIAVTPTCEYLIPARDGRIAVPGLGRLAESEATFQWPSVPDRLGGSIDYRWVPDTTEQPGYEMLYLTDLPDHWWAVRDRATRSGIGMAFDPACFRHLWLFQSAGGWRGLHVAVIEPCTSYPYDLPTATQAGRCPRLEPGQSLDTWITAVVFRDRDRIQQITQDGNVR